MEINYNLRLTYSVCFDAIAAPSSTVVRNATKGDGSAPAPAAAAEKVADVPGPETITAAEYEVPIAISDLISVNNAAKRRGVSRQSMYYQIKAGNLRAFLIDDVTFVFRAEVDALKPVRKK
jgi:hypothetical protein